jgi:SAM-dependent methyltransferase
MQNLEQEYDKILNIKTSGRDDSLSDLTNFPYEATPYLVLERLLEYNYISKKDLLIDFGCGKGRVDFFFSSNTKCKSIGIEFSKILYDRAIKNKESSNLNRVEFININAKDYQIPDDSTRFYFFNPFSIDVLKIVLKRINESYKKTKREILLFFYYPSKQYIELLNEEKGYILKDKISTMDLFLLNDIRENILVYEKK